MTPPPPARFDTEALRNGTDLRLVGWLAHKFGLTTSLSPEDLEDARQEIYFVLLHKAIPAYDPSRGAFSTFAVSVVRGHLGNWTEKRRRHGFQWVPGGQFPDRPISLSATSRRSGRTLAERLAGRRDNRLADRLDGARLFELANQLPDDERDLILAVYRDGQGIEEHGKAAGISRIWSSVRHRSALANLATLAAGGRVRKRRKWVRKGVPPWSPAMDARLVKMMAAGADRRTVAARMGRTERSVECRLYRLRKAGKLPAVALAVA